MILLFAILCSVFVGSSIICAFRILPYITKGEWECSDCGAVFHNRLKADDHKCEVDNAG